MIAYQLIKNTMGGTEPLSFVYLEKAAAELWAKDHKEEWIGYQVKDVELRILTEDEGAVGTQLVNIRRTTARDMHLARARSKLTKAEYEALVDKLIEDSMSGEESARCLKALHRLSSCCNGDTLTRAVAGVVELVQQYRKTDGELRAKLGACQRTLDTLGGKSL